MDLYPCALRRLLPLIRFGEEILPLLAKEKSASSDLIERSYYEIVMAAITGVEDKKLVGGLLAGDAYNMHLALEIIAASGSRDWFEELSRLSKSNDSEIQRKASIILQVCHGRDAIDVLGDGARDLRTWYE
jgi:hypothetical protein